MNNSIYKWKLILKELYFSVRRSDSNLNKSYQDGREDRVGTMDDWEQKNSLLAARWNKKKWWVEWGNFDLRHVRPLDQRPVSTSAPQQQCETMRTKKLNGNKILTRFI